MLYSIDNKVYQINQPCQGQTMTNSIYQINRHMDEYDYLLAKNEIIENELAKRRSFAMSKLAPYVSASMLDFFGRRVAEGYIEGYESACDIVQAVGLNRDDIKALLGDDDGIFEALCEQKKFEDAYENYCYKY